MLKNPVAPNGMMYVKPEVRKGLLGRMLIELLETRVMVKQAMKGVKDNKVGSGNVPHTVMMLSFLQMLKRILDARQLGLKYIANVTYGYTSATYSGRMPAVEIADSIVQSGRETLEKVRQITLKGYGAPILYNRPSKLSMRPKDGGPRSCMGTPIHFLFPSEGKRKTRLFVSGKTSPIQSQP